MRMEGYRTAEKERGIRGVIKRFLFLLQAHPDLLGYMYFRRLENLREDIRQYLVDIPSKVPLFRGGEFKKVMEEMEEGKEISSSLIAFLRKVREAVKETYVRDTELEELLLNRAEKLSNASLYAAYPFEWEERRPLQNLLIASDTLEDAEDLIGEEMALRNLSFSLWRKEKGKGKIKKLEGGKLLFFSSNYAPYDISPGETFDIDGVTIYPLHTTEVEIIGEGAPSSTSSGKDLFFILERGVEGSYSVSLSGYRKLLWSPPLDVVGHAVFLKYKGDKKALTSEEIAKVEEAEKSYLVVGLRADGIVIDPPLPSSSLPSSNWEIEVNPLLGKWRSGISPPYVPGEKRRYPIAPGIKLSGTPSGSFLPGEVVKDSPGENEYIATFQESDALYLLPTAGVLPSPGVTYSGTESGAVIVPTAVSLLSKGGDIIAGRFFEEIQGANIFAWRAVPIVGSSATIDTQGKMTITLSAGERGFLGLGMMPGDVIEIQQTEYTITKINSDVQAEVSPIPPQSVSGEWRLKGAIESVFLDASGSYLSPQLIDLTNSMPSPYDTSPYKKRTLWKVVSGKNDLAFLSLTLPYSSSRGSVGAEEVARMLNAEVSREDAGKRILFKRDTAIAFGNGTAHSKVGLPVNTQILPSSPKCIYEGEGVPKKGDIFLNEKGKWEVRGEVKGGYIVFPALEREEEVTLLSGLNLAWEEMERLLKRTLTSSLSPIDKLREISTLSIVYPSDELFKSFCAEIDAKGYELFWKAIERGEFYKLSWLDEKKASIAGFIEDLLPSVGAGSAAYFFDEEESDER